MPQKPHTSSNPAHAPLRVDGTHRVFQGIEWEKTVDVTERKFTANELIDAWYRGQKDAQEADVRLKIRTLDENVHKLNEVREEIYDYLKKRNLAPVGAFLRPDSWSIFRMVVIVTEETFLSDEFLSVFSYVRNKEEELAANTFCNLSVSFLEAASIHDINYQHLVSDGFLLAHSFTDEPYTTSRT